jgi:hypothetical protein
MQRVAREKEAQRSEHRQKQEEEAEALKKEEVDVLRTRENVGVLNIQPLAVRLTSHSPSSSKCEEGK